VLLQLNFWFFIDSKAYSKVLEKIQSTWNKRNFDKRPVENRKKIEKRMKHLNSQKYPSQHSNLKLLMMLITIYPNINENRYEIWLSLLRYDL
jgi:hypothetical protein